MHVNHVNVVVADMERSLAFYVGLLGMRVTFETHLTGDWIDEVVGLTGVSARCVFCQPEGGGNALANTHGLRHVALEVDDLNAWYAKLTAAGVEAVSPPVTVPFRIVDGIQKRLCYLRDPDGVIIELCEHLSVKESP
jgi:glyoxylase I family protein